MSAEVTDAHAALEDQALVSASDVTSPTGNVAPFKPYVSAFSVSTPTDGVRYTLSDSPSSGPRNPASITDPDASEAPPQDPVPNPTVGCVASNCAHSCSWLIAPTIRSAARGAELDSGLEDGDGDDDNADDEDDDWFVPKGKLVNPSGTQGATVGPIKGASKTG